MKKLLIVATVLAMAFNSCGGGGGRIKTDLDSLAYAIGVDLGTQIKATDSTMNPHLIAKGIIDAFKNRATMTRDSAVRIQQEYFMVKLPAKRERDEQTFLESIEKNHRNFLRTESGLLYEVVMPGDETMRATSLNDRVRVNYIGRLRGGATFDPKKEGEVFDEGHGVEFGLGQVIRGWGEGLQLVGQGGKIRLWIPSNIAYGPQGTYGGPIGPFEPLFFEVEVLEVIPFEEPVAAE
ncbi:MAG: FKBP-type peptidyl-prolyl cis-trans isomerase [Rikenellaceae bacterium]|nr:FKBP-type peptidyl-prolyl cis-trans isomerase [Rikenellaceae bacterium]MCL2693398.1 FKBP-type peptidyl-prolyl cis-trans isomerase [Rikenellaceae bacterium]